MKKYLQIFIIFLDFVAFAILTYFLFPKVFKTYQKAQELALPTNSAQKGESNQEPYNFLLLGYGGEGHDGGYLSDVVIVVHVDTSRKQINLISIPRDLWVDIPTRSDMSQKFKINAAYAIGRDDRNYPLKEPQYKGENGAVTLTKNVVSEVSGFQINNLIAVDFENFKRIVDTLGGVDVEVPVSFSDNFYPVKGLENETCGFSSAKIAELHEKFSGFDLEKQFECRYEHLSFEKGVQKMDGDLALKFVRSRHSAEDGSDFARSRRQDAVLLGVRSKLLSLYAVKKIDELYDELRGLVTTDMDLDSAKKIAGILGRPQDYKVKNVGLSVDNVLVATKSMDGQFILIPKEGENIWAGVQKFIHEEVVKP